MRRQLVLMTLAITSMIVIAFIVPLAFLVRTIASDRAVTRADNPNNARLHPKAGCSARHRLMK